MAPVLGEDEGAESFGVGLLIYSAVDGFLLGYLWARTVVSRLFSEAAEGHPKRRYLTKPSTRLDSGLLHDRARGGCALLSASCRSPTFLRWSIVAPTVSGTAWTVTVIAPSRVGRGGRGQVDPSSTTASWCSARVRARMGGERHIAARPRGWPAVLIASAAQTQPESTARHNRKCQTRFPRRRSMHAPHSRRP